MTAPPPTHPRDSGDAWVEGPDGRRFWGRFGAAGLLVHDEQAGILLQHRAEWSHFGGTWGLPGGARHAGESAVDGAIREAAEEAGVPADALEIAFTAVLDLEYWSYVTVVARTVRPFAAHIGDAESLELRWVPVDEVEALPLHPGFGSSWPALRERLGEGIRIVVDAANVVGSRPDGWWRDRAGAAERLLDRLQVLGAAGVDSGAFAAGGSRAGASDGLSDGASASGAESASVPASETGVVTASAMGGEAVLPGRSWPRFEVVLEGRATEAPTPSAGPVRVQRTSGSGDDAIVEAVRRPVVGSTIVVTADRELTRRVEALGAEVRGPGWLLRMLDEVGDAPMSGA
jgi:8-oxo-dGTP pyrophosphatase MutT (NUDIX family)